MFFLPRIFSLWILLLFSFLVICSSWGNCLEETENFVQYFENEINPKAVYDLEAKILMEELLDTLSDDEIRKMNPFSFQAVWDKIDHPKIKELNLRYFNKFEVNFKIAAVIKRLNSQKLLSWAHLEKIQNMNLRRYYNPMLAVPTSPIYLQACLDIQKRIDQLKELRTPTSLTFFHYLRDEYKENSPYFRLAYKYTTAKINADEMKFLLTKTVESTFKNEEEKIALIAQRVQSIILAKVESLSHYIMDEGDEMSRLYLSRLLSSLKSQYEVSARLLEKDFGVTSFELPILSRLESYFTTLLDDEIFNYIKKSKDGPYLDLYAFMKDKGILKTRKNWLEFPPVPSDSFSVEEENNHRIFSMALKELLFNNSKYYTYKILFDLFEDFELDKNTAIEMFMGKLPVTIEVIAELSENSQLSSLFKGIKFEGEDLFAARAPSQQEEIPLEKMNESAELINLKLKKISKKDEALRIQLLGEMSMEKISRFDLVEKISLSRDYILKALSGELAISKRFILLLAEIGIFLE